MDKAPELVEKIIKKYSKQDNHLTIENQALNITSKGIVYKIIRLADEQYYSLRKNSVPISEDNMFFYYLSSKKDLIYQSFSRMYITLKYLFGNSGKCYDSWKGAFSFPFLICFEKNKQESEYTMNVHNIRSSIEFSIDKLIISENNKFEKGIIHEPFDDFTKDEINNLLACFIGYLTGFFEEYIEKMYHTFFYEKTKSDLIIFGFKDGKFFDNHYESEEMFNKEIELLEKINI